MYLGLTPEEILGSSHLLELPLPLAVAAVEARGKGHGLHAYEWAFCGDEALETVPQNLKVSSFLLRSCPRLIAIGSGFESAGLLEISNCGLLPALPEGIRCLGLLRIDGCSSFTRMPLHFECRRVQLVDIPLIQSLHLPEGFVGGVYLTDCPSLVDLDLASPRFEELKVSHCAVSSLPDGLEVANGFDLLGLPLNQVPSGLHVLGSCSVRDLPVCISFGEGISIGKDLTLSNIPNLLHIPESIEVCGAVRIGPTFPPERLPRHLRDRLIPWEE